MGPWAQGEGSLENLSNDAVITLARHLHRQFQLIPRWHQDNERLLIAWGAVCGEMSQRGITDPVTEQES